MLEFKVFSFSRNRSFACKQDEDLKHKMNRTQARYPVIVFAGLLVIIGIAGFKYWKLTVYVYEIEDNFYALETTVNQLKFEKNSIDKSKSVCDARVKAMEKEEKDIQELLNVRNQELYGLRKFKTDVGTELVIFSNSYFVQHRHSSDP